MAAPVERRTQILKGVLDLCVLSVLSNGPTYGYGLVDELRNNGLPLVAEGSVYPLLARLAKSGFVRTYTEPSPSGPARKYYAITPEGQHTLAEGACDWFDVSTQVNTLLRSSDAAHH